MTDRSLYFKAIDLGDEQARVEAERNRIQEAQQKIHEQRDRLLAEREYLVGLVERLKEQEKFRALEKKMPFEPMNYNSVHTCPRPPLLQHLQPIPAYLMPTMNTSFPGSLQTTKNAPEAANAMACNRMDQNMDMNIPNTSSMVMDRSADCTTEALEADIERLIQEMSGLMIMCSSPEDEIDN